MESFEQKIKERNNLLKSQVESLTGRNELVEVVDTLLKAGVTEEDLVEKAKYIRRESDGKGGYKYIYSEPKENKIKTDKVDNKEEDVNYFVDKFKNKMSHATASTAAWWIDGIKELSNNQKKQVFESIKNSTEKESGKREMPEWINKSSESDIEKSKDTEEQKAKIAKVMKEFKDGSLKSSSGEKVSDPKQAIAIAMSEAKVTKSELIDLIKSRGEGSKGGKIIGHTRSGKPIYESHLMPKTKHKVISAYDNFSKEDHQDAQDAHNKILTDAYQKYGTDSSGRIKKYDFDEMKHRMSENFHRGRISSEDK